MEVVEDPEEFRRALARARGAGETVGLVPTMGALHAGHRSLLDRAVAERDHVAASIFVNPLQFDSASDLAAYPRDLDADLAVCAEAGAQTVFAPTAAVMFAPGSATTVSVAALGGPWEGASRPGHFDGVATVVAKLCSLAGSCAAYFGEKDFQQLVVVRRMVADLSIPVEIVACPTVRDPDGLACSSRNVRLSAEERRAATALWRALSTGVETVAAGEERPAAVADAMARVVAAEPLVRLDYAAAVDARSLAVPTSLADPDELRLLVAAQVGPVRLIDNCRVAVPGHARGATRASSVARATGHEPAPASVLAGAAARRHNRAGAGNEGATGASCL